MSAEATFTVTIRAGDQGSADRIAAAAMELVVAEYGAEVSKVMLSDCEDCGHQRSEHSSESGVGCLHVLTASDTFCRCLRAGTSGADQ